ncbi:MAG: enoyl-CoA hydratase-related protein [Solirubrobacterales bacterium]
MIQIEREGDVFVLRMVADENRFNPEMLAAFDRALSEVEAVEGPAAVVLTGEGKFFSNGLDLDWMGQNPDRAGEVVNGLQALYARVLAFPRAVIAAINGHAFAGGGMLALACDQRVMREDRGFFCLPEVDIRIPFSDGMAALVQAKLTPSVAHEVMVTGRRYGGTEAAGAGIVDLALPEAEVVQQAIERAAGLADKDPGVVSQIKTTMYGGPLGLLGREVDLGGLGD